MTFQEIQDQIITEMEPLDEGFGRYEYLIEQAKALSDMPEEVKTEDALIASCQSQAWLSIRSDNGRLRVYADSDTQLTRGILALLVRVLDGQQAKDVAGGDLYFIDKTGLSTSLSPSRTNGLKAVLDHLHRRVKEVV